MVLCKHTSFGVKYRGLAAKLIAAIETNVYVL